jgi:hypothetical protein
MNTRDNLFHVLDSIDILSLSGCSCSIVALLEYRFLPASSTGTVKKLRASILPPCSLEGRTGDKELDEENRSLGGTMLLDLVSYSWTFDVELSEKTTDCSVSGVGDVTVNAGTDGS